MEFLYRLPSNILSLQVAVVAAGPLGTLVLPVAAVAADTEQTQKHFTQIQVTP